MFGSVIYTTIKDRKVVGDRRWPWEAACCAWLAGRGRHTLRCQPASSRRWAVEVFTHAHVSMITYRVDVYRSRPIGASLLCQAPKGLYTGAGWAWWWRMATCGHGFHMI